MDSDNIERAGVLANVCVDADSAYTSVYLLKRSLAGFSGDEVGKLNEVLKDLEQWEIAAANEILASGFTNEGMVALLNCAMCVSRIREAARMIEEVGKVVSSTNNHELLSAVKEKVKEDIPALMDLLLDIKNLMDK